MPTLVKNYKHDPDLREAFYEFTPQALWGINFKPWAEKGYWDSLSYDGYALMENGKMVANVSYTIMKMKIDHQLRTLLQIGTVGTLEEYRNKGYSRQLLEEILKDWEGKVDWIFLFANENVLSFYPKFGFERVENGVFTLQFPERKRKEGPSLKKILFPEQEEWFWQKVKTRLPVSAKFGSLDGHEIMMLYISLGYSEYVWYEETTDSIVIMEEKEGTLHLYDWIFQKEHDVHTLLAHIPFKEGTQCVVHFMNDQVEELGVLNEEDSMFFLRAAKEEKETFPHEFVFPVLYKT